MDIILVIVGLIIILVLIYSYRKVPPNKVLIITRPGRRKTVAHKGTIVFPLVQSAQEFSLEERIIHITISQELTLDKIPLSVEAVATIKIDSSNQANILRAAEKFLEKTDREMDKDIKRKSYKRTHSKNKITTTP